MPKIFALLMLSAAAAVVPVLAQPCLAQGADKTATPDELNGAVPMDEMSRLPTPEEQYRRLQKEIEKNRPAVEAAKKKSDALAAETRALQEKLVRTAARVQALESEKVRLDREIVQLTQKESRLAADFARDRVAVSRLLAILQRLEHDTPPVLVL
ncbi:MAG: hypothetical protein J0H30_08165, partial [Alphaproteobacteria bacterium]|nr:hypothetical protein [Alphaproteobacteria bacterium]